MRQWPLSPSSKEHFIILLLQLTSQSIPYRELLKSFKQKGEIIKARLSTNHFGLKSQEQRCMHSRGQCPLTNSRITFFLLFYLQSSGWGEPLVLNEQALAEGWLEESSEGNEEYL